VNHTVNLSPMNLSGLSFRNLRGEEDYALLLELNGASREADHDPELVSLELIANVLDNMDGITATQGVIIACDGEKAVGYSRLGYYSSRPETRLYYQISFLIKEYREKGVWPLMVAENESRLRQLAVDPTGVRERYFQAWASDFQKDWIAVLESCGYRVTRRFNNMLFQLEGEISVKPLPPGLEVRPVLPEHMRSVWEAQKEMNAGLFENVAEDWVEEKFPVWLANPENNPRFWQVAWDGDRLAGMVLAHSDDKANLERDRKHSYTEHIFVRPAWRGRGLASALIGRSLQVLKEHGMSVAELGVDTENESAAFRLYENLGYRTYQVDTWFRKPIL
jgi:mycothiol synthase